MPSEKSHGERKTFDQQDYDQIIWHASGGIGTEIITASGMPRKNPSENQKAALGHKCATALLAWQKSRTRKPKEERLAEQRIRSRASRKKTRNEMIQAYGGKCVHCGIDDAVVLALDHINDDGAVGRRSGGDHGGWVFYRKLKEAGWPKDHYQLLCHNCNFRKEYKRREYAVLNA